MSCRVCPPLWAVLLCRASRGCKPPRPVSCGVLWRLRHAADSCRPCIFCPVALLQSLTPQITENKRKTEELLREAYTLCTCLSQRVSAGVLEKLLPKRYKQYAKGIGSKN